MNYIVSDGALNATYSLGFPLQCFAFIVFHSDLLEISPSWKNWIRDIDHITKYLQTGVICHGCKLSQSNHCKLIEKAEKYYVASEFIGL